MAAIEISGAELAARFYKVASSVLLYAGSIQLERFLSTASQSSVVTPDTESAFSERLQQFYNEEVKISGGDRNRLATPSGPLSAALGLIMHVQTKKGAIRSFWDEENISIQALAAKGLSDSFVFGFDWHWRAEDSARRRGACPTSTWTEPLRQAHDRISRDVLAMLPLPFVVVAGACLKRQYQKLSCGTVISLEIEIIPQFALAIDLRFDNEELRRVTIYVDHPLVGFYNPSTAEAQALRLDAAFNLVLWLLKRNHFPTSFQCFYDAYRRNSTVPNSAPFAELWKYVGVETERQTILRLEEYEPSFLRWAEKYLGENPAAIIERGQSIVSVIKAEFRSRRREDGQKNQSWQSKRRPRGAVCIPCRKVHRLQCDGKFPCSTCIRLGITCKSGDLQRCISDYRVQSVVQQTNNSSTATPDNSGRLLTEPIKTIAMESSGRVKPPSNLIESLPALDTKRNLTSSDSLSRHNRRISRDRYKCAINEYWHGRPVTVRKNGDIRIHTSADMRSLMWRMGPRQAAGIREHTETPTIHFCLQGIQLQYNGSVLFTRTISAIRNSCQQGAEWEAQWEKEVRKLDRKLTAIE